MGINETDEHIIEKFLQWLSLRRRGHRVLTECIFENNKGRADLLDLSNCTIIEVVKSETMESIEKKKLKYPSELEVKVVRCE